MGRIAEQERVAGERYFRTLAYSAGWINRCISQTGVYNSVSSICDSPEIEKKNPTKNINQTLKLTTLNRRHENFMEIAF